MSESMVALEVAEMEAFADLDRAASPEVVAASGMSVTDVADAILLAANRIDVLALNRVMGLGLRDSPLDSALADVVDACGRTDRPSASGEIGAQEVDPRFGNAGAYTPRHT